MQKSLTKTTEATEASTNVVMTTKANLIPELQDLDALDDTAEPWKIALDLDAVETS